MTAHDRAWRDPRAVVAQWTDAGTADARLLAATARGGWWDALGESGATLLVSREYEHLLLAISTTARPRISYLRLPHPSGIAFDAARGRAYVAATRNPNQIYELGPATGLLPRADLTAPTPDVRGRLVPLRTWYLPGSTYLHDLALIGGRLHGNAVGRNAVVEIADGEARAVWWPASVDRGDAPRDDRNYLQLNAIAAGRDLASSYFTASTERPGRRRPGDPAFPVDRRGVLFSGATREPVVRGLTRPHSARLHDGRVWLDDSGYGTVGAVDGTGYETIAKLPGWTRGLGFAGGIAFVGTSRVIPRFRAYAPGLDVARSVCAIHALDAATGRVRGSLLFPSGDQIFAIEPVPAAWTSGLPFGARTSTAAARDLFYAFARDGSD